MRGFYVFVPNMTVDELTALVKQHLPSLGLLHRLARGLGIADRCPHSGDSLESFIERYTDFPCDPDVDQTAFVREAPADKGPGAVFVQIGSGSTEIKYPLRRLVQGLIVVALMAAGHHCNAYEV